MRSLEIGATAQITNEQASIDEGEDWHYKGQIGSSGSVLYVTDGSKDYGLFFGHLPSSDEKGRTFKFPFIVYEIFTCEVDIILKALVEDEELMNMLFSFLEPEHPHSALLAGYFSKVVCRAGPSIIQMKLGL
ncbi:putative SIT4 phosphatase-associated protein family [Helianthus annuus]|nr:putative SIT4 phosphatase-associated protein family [Helianthus annuus]